MSSEGKKWIADLFQSNIREKKDRKVGIEIERIGIWKTGQPFLYEEKEGRPGAAKLLCTLSKENKWPLISNQWGRPLGLTAPAGKVTLEPGSQVELSADPHETLLQVEAAAADFEKTVAKITEPWGMNWIALGVNPIHKVDEIDLIPSPRYAIMTKYFNDRTRYGTSMMRRTSSVQLNLDYTSEEEAIEMLRAALALTPVSYALFANSPLLEKKDSGFLAFRSAIWRETDPHRTGLLPEAFAKNFGFKEYAEYLWNKPLMFVQDTEDQYVAAEGKSLAQIEKGEIPGVEIDEHNKWNSVRELFTETRLKPGYVEVRSIDGLLPKDRSAATAFWLGILYSEDARKLVLKLLGGMDAAVKNELWIASTKMGFKAKVGGIDLKDVSKQLIAAAEACLKSRGFGEEKLLKPLHENFEAGVSPAEKLMQKFHGEWKGDLNKVLEYSKFPTT